LEKVYWLGGKEEVCGYVAEKARIGMGIDHEEWDVQEVKEKLLWHIAYVGRELKETFEPGILDEDWVLMDNRRKVLRDLCESDLSDPHQVVTAIYEEKLEEYVEPHTLWSVPSSVYYTHAALRRLHLLLTA